MLVAMSVCGPSCAGQPDLPRQGVMLLEMEGVINPLTQRYLARGLEAAAQAENGLVVVRLDTPGGTMTAMREMTKAILQSPVPVVVYVAPAGARAASAGMFITAAAHVAAMAPGTNIGAAHPVSLGGARQQDQTDKTMEGKVVNDAAAMVRAIAATRGRNAEWLESAVRESASITAEEAADKRVIDLVAPDLETLLSRLDGRVVETVAGERTLQTAEAQVTPRPMNLAERVLHTITDPNIAYILFTIGMIGLVAELYSPGLILPGVVGLLSLVLAFSAFGSLPISWGGVALLVLGLGLVVAELLTAGIGFMGVVGGVAFLLGSLMLYRPPGPVSPSMPDLHVSPWVVALMVVLLATFLVVVIRGLLVARRAPVQTGMTALLGRTGVATTPLMPRGAVRVGGEAWSAFTKDPPIHPGERVRVVEAHGTVLRVVKNGEEQGG